MRVLLCKVLSAIQTIPDCQKQHSQLIKAYVGNRELFLYTKLVVSDCRLYSVYLIGNLRDSQFYPDVAILIAISVYKEKVWRL